MNCHWAVDNIDGAIFEYFVVNGVDKAVVWQSNDETWSVVTNVRRDDGFLTIEQAKACVENNKLLYL